MQIKMLTRSAGPNGNRAVGQVLTVGEDISDDEAAAYLAGHYAEEVNSEPVEVVEEKPVEKAVARVQTERATKPRKSALKDS